MTDLRQFFFQGLRRKHLFIITCIEKQCTWPLKWFENILLRLKKAILILELSLWAQRKRRALPCIMTFIATCIFVCIWSKLLTTNMAKNRTKS